jgi:hypothetical protein
MHRRELSPPSSFHLLTDRPVNIHPASGFASSWLIPAQILLYLSDSAFVPVKDFCPGVENRDYIPHSTKEGREQGDVRKKPNY